MSKQENIPVEVIRQVLIERGLVAGTDLAQAIHSMLEAARAAQEADEADKEEPKPRTKKQNVVLISDPEGKFAGVELTAFVMAIAEDSSVFSITDSLATAAQNHNLTKKGRRLPLNSMNETMADCPAKILKEAGVWPVGKREAVYVLFHNNLINDKGGEATRSE